MQNINSNNTQQQPYNNEAEQAIIGLFLNNNHNIIKVSDILAPDHFYVKIHKMIYECMLKLCDRGLIATPISIKSHIADDVFLQTQSLNCFDYLMRLASNAQLISDVRSLSILIHDLYVRRCLIEISHEIIIDSHASNINKSTEQRLEFAEQKLFNLATKGRVDRDFVDMRSVTVKALESIALSRQGGYLNGVQSGFHSLDKLTGGLHNSDLIIIAARPGMGKTSFAINIALNVASSTYHQSEKHISSSGNASAAKTHCVGIFSLEMSSQQIMNRMLSVCTKIDGSRIRIGAVDNDELRKLSLEVHKLNNLEIFIDDTPALTISAVRAKARRLKRQHDVKLIIIDYLQLMRASPDSRIQNRVQEIGEISQGLKALAKELNVPVIALSQLSRAVESREDKRPQLSDLRDSGNIEQDADVVQFLYRHEYYLAKDRDKKDAELMEVANTAQLIIAKQRNGPIGNTMLHFDSSTTCFSNLDQH